MERTFTFANQAAYLTSKASGDLSKLYTSTDVSRSAVSLILDTGVTVIDSINTIVPREQGGIGDLLIYKGGSYYWVKGARAWNASEVGGYVLHGSTLTGYTKIGFCIHRQGNNCLICSCANIGSTYAWSPDTSTTIPGVTTISSIVRGDGYSTWIASGSLARAEQIYGAGVYQYTWPLPRNQWEAAKAAAFSNTASSGTFTDGSWKTTAGSYGVASCTITYKCTEGSVTINPADYKWDFETWYNKKVLLKYPSSTGCMTDDKGRENTRALVASSVSTPAADACNSYGISGVTDYVAGKWWLPSITEMWRMLENYHALVKKGCPITNSWYWSSTQSSGSNAWRVPFNTSSVSYNPKSNSLYVRACSAFHI